MHSGNPADSLDMSSDGKIRIKDNLETVDLNNWVNTGAPY